MTLQQLQKKSEKCDQCGSARAETIGFVSGPGRVCLNAAQCDRRARDRAIAAAMIERHEAHRSRHTDPTE